MVFIKLSFFPLVLQVRNTIKEECFKRKLVNFFRTCWQQQHSVERRIEVGQVYWLGSHGPCLYHTVTQQCSYLPGKVGADRNDRGRGGYNTPCVDHCVPVTPLPLNHSVAPPFSPSPGGPSGRSQTTTWYSIRVMVQYHQLPTHQRVQKYFYL